MLEVIVFISKCRVLWYLNTRRFHPCFHWVLNYMHVTMPDSSDLLNYSWIINDLRNQFLKHADADQNGSKHCNFCLEEKVCLLKANEEILLNKHPELISKCHHENKLYFPTPPRKKKIWHLSPRKFTPVYKPNKRDTYRN